MVEGTAHKHAISHHLLGSQHMQVIFPPSHRFKTSVRVVRKASWLAHFELIQQKKRIQVFQLKKRIYFLHHTGMTRLTSGLPTLLLTRAPTPSACSTESTFFTIALAVMLTSCTASLVYQLIHSRGQQECETTCTERIG